MLARAAHVFPSTLTTPAARYSCVQQVLPCGPPAAAGSCAVLVVEGASLGRVCAAEAVYGFRAASLHCHKVCVQPHNPTSSRYPWAVCSLVSRSLLPCLAC